jgi:hypothetical protein
MTGGLDNSPTSPGNICRLTGISMKTGPGSPEWAISQALNSVGAISAWRVTRKAALVSGLRKAC